MSAEAELTPTSYIQHHLKNLTTQVGEGGFWVLNVDTFVTAVLMGLLMVFMFWLATRKATAGVPGKWQAFVEICLEFVDRQARENGVNTAYGRPSGLRTWPGGTAYGEPTRRIVTPRAASRTVTWSSRRRPYGAKSSATNTPSAPISAASAGTTSTGSP